MTMDYEYKSVVERISEIANKYCADYPNIKTVDSLEKLYAIESTLKGTNAANDDLHKLIEILRVRCSMEKEELFKIFDKLILDEEKKNGQKK